MGKNLEHINRVSTLLPGMKYLYDGVADSRTVTELFKQQYLLETADCETVLHAAELGVPAENIYYDISLKAPWEDLGACWGKCRYVAGSLDEMLRLNDLIAGHASTLHPQPVEIIGIHVIPEGFESDGHFAFRAGELAGFVSEFRRLQHVSVRGCFVRGSLTDAYGCPIHGAKLGKFFRACYETAKGITVTLPTQMAYVTMVNTVEALWENAVHHPETLSDCLQAAEIVKQQNETAFYAKLLMS